MNDYRVKRGYTVHMRSVAHEEGTLIETVTDEELKAHGIRMEPADHEAMRMAMNHEEHAKADHNARVAADAKYTQMYERTLTQVAADLLKKNPQLAYKVAELVGEQQAKQLDADLEEMLRKEADENAPPAPASQHDGLSAVPGMSEAPVAGPVVTPEGAKIVEEAKESKKKK